MKTRNILYTLSTFLIALTFSLLIYSPAYAKSSLNLSYDDRYTFKHSITSIKTMSVTSRKCGENTKDKKVAKKISAKKIKASGCGKAIVTLSNGSKYTLNVRPAKISLFLIAGQSNSEGKEAFNSNLHTYKMQRIINEEGTVYNTYGPSTVSETQNCFKEIGWFKKTGKPLSINNAKDFIPKSLTNNKSPHHWQRTNNLTNARGAHGKAGLDSALAHEWYQQTGEKIWLINAGHRSESITTWQPGEKITDNNYWQAVKLYQYAEKLLSKEIKCGHYRLSHKGAYWLQGETDWKMSQKEYTDYFTNMQKGFIKDLNGQGIPKMNHPLEVTGILHVRGNRNDCKSGKSLDVTGPRLAQMAMANSNSGICRNIIMVSSITNQWYSDASVRRWFKNRYGSNNGYAKANRWRRGTYPLCTKIDDLHPNLHYTQLAYNELGYDAAKNMATWLNY